MEDSKGLLNSPTPTPKSIFHKINFVKDDILDIINGQGCLIKQNSTILFSSKEKVKDLNHPYKVTSKGYITCAEITGELSNGDKFYIHARDISDFIGIMNQIHTEEQNNDGEGIIVDNIKIQCDFDKNEDNEYESKAGYIRACKKIGISPEILEITNSSILPKVMSYNRIKNRDF